MINLSFLTELHAAFPNATVSDPFMNASYMYDIHKNLMGHFDYAHSQFYLNENYEFIKEAKYQLDKNDIHYAIKEYNEAEILYG